MNATGTPLTTSNGLCFESWSSSGNKAELSVERVANLGALDVEWGPHEAAFQESVSYAP